MFVLLLFVLLPLTALAGPVDESAARQRAQAFLQERGKSLSKARSIHKAPQRRTAQKVEVPAYYVFNVGETDGFVVVSGDDRTTEILGYADSGNLDMDALPDGLQYLLEGYETQISFMNNEKVTSNNARKSVSSQHRLRSYEPIEPLIESRWSQGKPYNNLCPEIDGTKPYQQLCFQYSLHIMDENGKLIHKEFLSENYNGDFVREMCEQLIKDIPLNACTIVYNKSFEVPRLKEMANMYEDISEHLLNIANNIVDLADIFSNQSYYTKEMGGSYSIKKVLPALFPNEPELDYHSLDQVHKGDEASAAFLSLRDLGDEDRKKLRNNMLKYCCLDTYAMVKIYEKLKSI